MVQYVDICPKQINFCKVPCLLQCLYFHLGYRNKTFDHKTVNYLISNIETFPFPTLHFLSSLYSEEGNCLSNFSYISLMYNRLKILFWGRVERQKWNSTRKSRNCADFMERHVLDSTDAPRASRFNLLVLLIRVSLHPEQCRNCIVLNFWVSGKRASRHKAANPQR